VLREASVRQVVNGAGQRRVLQLDSTRRGARGLGGRRDTPSA
jgi:hypothetical protein